MAVEQERIEVQKIAPRVMAQSSGFFTSLAEARPEESVEHHFAAVNPRPDFADLGGGVGATTAEILGCLHQYATFTRLNLARTLTLGRLQSKLTTQLQRLNANRVVSSDRNNDCDEVNLRVDTCCEEALQALIDSEMMVEEKGTRPPTCEDPTTDLTGTEFTLQDTEAFTGSLASLDELFSSNGQLPPTGGDVEDQPGGLAYLQDDTFNLILSVDQSDTCFADPDGCPTEDGTTSLAMKTTTCFRRPR
jgi:hypothetical protein